MISFFRPFGVLVFFWTHIKSRIACTTLFQRTNSKWSQYGSKKKYHGGYFLGFNNFDFNIDYKEDLKDIQTERFHWF